MTRIIARIAPALLLVTIASGTLSGQLRDQTRLREYAERTTRSARELVLTKIDTIEQTASCRQVFQDERIDLARLRRAAYRTRFYSVVGPEGNLTFSKVVGRPASPDDTLRELAREISADAFVLGYLEGPRYVRTSHVVLSHGYFAQEDAEHNRQRLTTPEEKQTLLLHELLHIALGIDDDDLNRRELCTLRLITFCPRKPASTTIAGY
ncbi:MAG TPA: hypothetical protein VES20_06775 [Bryobacteraceae bacterium]|nr:hypothetical protein [Bryobacteraceae bacterium]